MSLDPGETIFDKMSISYDELRCRENPIREIIQHYRSNLKPGEKLWWLEQGDRDHEDIKYSNIYMTLWNNLSASEKFRHKCRAFVYFPEIAGNSGTKFNRLATWFVAEHSLVVPNLRDPFTAGGTGSVTIGNRTYSELPRIVWNLFDHIEGILDTLNTTSAAELSEAWGCTVTDEDKHSTWIDLISEYTSTILKDSSLNLNEELNRIFST